MSPLESGEASTYVLAGRRATLCMMAGSDGEIP